MGFLVNKYITLVLFYQNDPYNEKVPEVVPKARFGNFCGS